mmetsp:Transcript_13018/g.18733  ORF Transcript_13018/g.18733 Transcript_13018/m.18733 type:complete len:130 (-) Transcript_13018:45-434(-)
MSLGKDVITAADWHPGYPSRPGNSQGHPFQSRHPNPAMLRVSSTNPPQPSISCRYRPNLLQTEAWIRQSSLEGSRHHSALNVSKKTKGRDGSSNPVTNVVKQELLNELPIRSQQAFWFQKVIAISKRER